MSKWDTLLIVNSNSRIIGCVFISEMKVV